MKTVFKIMIGIVLGFTVLIGGCAVLIGAGVNEAQKESDKTSITVQQYGEARTGTSRTAIEARFGEPQSQQDVQAEGIKGIPDSDFQQSCIYYNRKGQLASLFQFCFDGDGSLTSKASF